MSDLDRLLTAVSPQKVAVIGDIILDEHVYCDVLGISPEDDLAPKLRVSSRVYKLGGAANTAHNLKTLGVEQVYLFGRRGNGRDTFFHFDMLCTEADIIAQLCHSDVDIPVKSRYLTRMGRHVARVDCEQISPMRKEETAEILKLIDECGPFRFIVVSDYAKGTITEELMQSLGTRGCLIVDPKIKDFRKYGNVHVITPNEKEWEACMLYAGKAKNVVVTLSGVGCRWVGCDGYAVCNVRTREVGDPTGCGDSFIAGLTYALMAGLAMPDACCFANAVGACAYDHTGVHAVTREEVQAELKTFEYGREGCKPLQE